MKCPCNHCKYQAIQPELHVEKISNKKTIRRNIWVLFTEDLILTTPNKSLLLAQGETPMSPILCGYEYWVSFWLVCLGSISHISSVLAVVILLRGIHFSCHRGRAAPNTLNDPPLGETTLHSHGPLNIRIFEYSNNGSQYSNTKYFGTVQNFPNMNTNSTIRT